MAKDLKNSAHPSTHQPKRADPLMRLLAHALDLLLPFVPVVFFSILSIVLGGPQKSMTHEETAFVVLMFLVVMAALVIMQLVFLTRDGQTIAKKIFRIRIVDRETHKVGGFVQNFLLRSVLSTFLCVVPFYRFVDIFLLFLEDQRTLHDRIAGTIVIEAK